MSSTIQSFSIIVPAYNCEKVIVRTLESIEASIQFFYKHEPGAEQVRSEIIVINDGSADDTARIVEAFIQGKPHYQFINHFKSLGAGPSRNIGAKVAMGEAIFFMDGDDLFFPEHVYICLKILNHQPGADAPNQFTLPETDPPQTLPLPNQTVGAVKTGIRTEDTLHPYWKTAIENGAPINLCLRRECHEFVEGYPEAAIYKKVGREDIAYYVWLSKFFKIVKLDRDTVEYIKYPHNNLTRQLKKFQTPPEQCPPEPVTPEERELHLLANKLEEEKLRYLLEKAVKLNREQLPVTWMHWPQLAQDLLVQQKYAEAIFLYEQGVAAEPAIVPQIKNTLAVAYNNWGSVLHKQGDLAQAVQYFQKAIQVQPDVSPADLARIYYNVGTVLKSQGQLEQALAFLQKALELEPGLTQASTELHQTRYQLQVHQRGYQFEQDWFSRNIANWEKLLASLKHQPDLRVLEIGSWEGRSTCWLLDNLLTHASARITCIDSFQGSVEHQQMSMPEQLAGLEQRFDQNIALSGAADKVRKLVGQSQDVLRSLPLDYFHLLYVDGSHLASDVLSDAVLGWGLVKVGGLIIFDDYDFQFTQNPLQNPKVGIDGFLSAFSAKIKILQRDYQVVVEKVTP